MLSPSLRVPTPRAVLAAAVAVLLLGLALTVVAPGLVPSAQAAPCTCKPAKGMTLGAADVVVTGTIAAVSDTANPKGSTFDVTLTRIYKGEVSTPTLSFTQNPGCPIKTIAAGDVEWIVVARTIPLTQASASTGGAVAGGPSGTPSVAVSSASPTNTPSPSASAPLTGEASASSSASGQAAGDTMLEAIGCSLTGPRSDARMQVIARNFGTGTAPVKPKPPAPTLTKVETAGPDRFTRLAAPGAAMFVFGLLGFVGVRQLGRSRRR